MVAMIGISFLTWTWTDCTQVKRGVKASAGHGAGGKRAKVTRSCNWPGDRYGLGFFAFAATTARSRLAVKMSRRLSPVFLAVSTALP
jgi:hypothetical protein